MAWNIYIEDAEAIPAIAVDTSAPAGFSVSTNPTIDWDRYAPKIVDNSILTMSEIRTEIAAEYASVTWGSGSAAQQAVWSKWFVATKAERDTVHTAAQQEANANELGAMLVAVREAELVADYVALTKDAEPAAVDNEVQDTEEGGNTIVTSGAGTKALHDDGTYKVVGGGGQAAWSIPSESIYANAATRSFIAANSQSYLAFSGTGAVDDAGTSFIIPPDYGSGLKFRIGWIMDGTSTNQGRIALNIVQATDMGAADSATPDETIEILDDGQATTAWMNQITAYGASGLTWAAGETCVVELERDPGHASDTMTDTFYLKYLVVEYTKI